MARTKMYVSSAKAERELGYAPSEIEPALERPSHGFARTGTADRRRRPPRVRRLPEARRLGLGLRWSAECELDGRRALLVAHGPGQANARVAVERVFGTLEVQGVVSAGFVGALDPVLGVADIFVASGVRRFETTVEYPVELPRVASGMEYTSGVLLTADRVAQTVDEKRSLRALGATAVDMEAAAVAAEADRWGVRLLLRPSGQRRRPDGPCVRLQPCAASGRDILGLVDRGAGRPAARPLEGVAEAQT